MIALRMRICVSLRRTTLGVSVVRGAITIERCLGAEIPVLKLVVARVEVVGVLGAWIVSTASVVSASPVAPLVIVSSVTVVMVLETVSRSTGLRLDLAWRV